MPATRRSPAGFIRPCAPALVRKPPAGPDWIHEIKHDGYRILAVRDAAAVKLWSRSGTDWTQAFPAITNALRGLRATSLTLDGEMTAHDENGLPDFHGLRARAPANPTYYAFDLLQLDGEDLRPLPLSKRRDRLTRLLKRAPAALRFSEHLEGDGAIIFQHACALGFEGIVSKRKEGRYISGPSRNWLKTKNPTYRRRESRAVQGRPA